MPRELGRPLTDLFIAVVINNLEEAKRERERERVAQSGELLRELRAARETLARIERELQQR